MADDVAEPVVVPSAYVDGLASVRVDASGVARVNLYAEQLEADGNLCRILAARLTMPCGVMRDIADRMLSEGMMASYRRDGLAEERRRKLD